SFVTNVFATQPTGTKAIGEIVLKTLTGVDFGGFVIERGALSPGDPNGDPHYDVVWPNVPIVTGLCPVTATSPGAGYSIGIQGTTQWLPALPVGTGRPSTAQLRLTKDNAQAGSTTSAFLTSEDPAVPLTGAQYSRICVIPAGKPTVNFKCGTG